MIKRKLIYLFAVLCAILVVGGSKAQAQVISELKAKIPFEFHAGGATLPAGNYTINVLGGIESNLVEIRSDDNHSSALLQTMDVESGNQSKPAELLFDHTDGAYYLARIFNQNEDAGVAVIDSSFSKKYGESVPPVDTNHVEAVYKAD
jgi:hypothetical protein